MPDVRGALGRDPFARRQGGSRDKAQPSPAATGAVTAPDATGRPSTKRPRRTTPTPVAPEAVSPSAPPAPPSPEAPPTRRSGPATRRGARVGDHAPAPPPLPPPAPAPPVPVATEDPDTTPVPGDQVDDLDLGWCQAFRPVAEVLSKHYWRMALSGLEHLPAEGPAVLVCNHGGLLPWDALVLAHRLAWQDRPGRQVRPVLDDDMLRLPLLGPALRRLGAVAAGSVWPERLLQEGAVLLLFPETARVGGRPIWHRYRVHPWGRGWFVRMAARAGAPLIPTAIVGSEEAFPVLARLGWPARRVGLPPLPITPTFPWLGPLGLLPLPSKWSVRLGPPLANLAQRLEGEEPTASQDVSEELRARLQAMLREDVEARRSVLRG